MKEMDSTEPQSTNVSTTPSPEVVHPVSTTPSSEVVPSGVMKSLVLTCRFTLGGVGVLASSSAADVMQIGDEVQKAAEVGAAIEAMLASVAGSTNLESIQIIKKAGGSLKDSFDTVLKLDNRSSAYSCQLNVYVGNIDSFTFRRGDITMLDINLFVISHEKHTGTKIITYH
ncbi:hypothetical protein Tco_0221164 [Tanacetum coccineum]